MLTAQKTSKYRIKNIFSLFERSLRFYSEIKWSGVALVVFYHIFAIYWCYFYAFPAKWQTIVFAALMYVTSSFGVTAGAHRLWAHKSYKATAPLQLLLLICFSSSGQKSVLDWVRDHKVHHKHSDTDADPHNISRGLFFSHVGWMMMQRHPKYLQALSRVDISDLEHDPLIRVHERYCNYFRVLFCFVLPTWLSVWAWGETWQCAVAWQCGLRFLAVTHALLTVNSLAHAVGYRPYNKTIKPAENNFVAAFTLGEGWHNYHHAFPFDYKSGEHFDVFNWSTKLIWMFSKIGWAYDLKEATPEMVRSLTKRLGDHDDL